MKQVIIINGKEHPFALTFGALHRLKREHNIANINKVFSEIEEGGFEPLCKVVYEGVKSGYGKENKEKDFTQSYDSFADTIDIKDMAILANAIVEAMVGKTETTQIEEGKAEEVSPNEQK